MEIIIHRGSNQIGGSCVELRSKTKAILLDIGLPLDWEDQNTEEIHPKIPGIFKNDSNLPSVDAIIISHPHLDHYGLIEDIKETIPIYIGESGWRIISAALPFLGKDVLSDKSISFFTNEKMFEIVGFQITPYLMDHSAFDAYAFHVTDGEKSIIYTGDFRNHGRKKKMYTRFLQQVPKQVDALIMEGTTLSRKPGRKGFSEQEVEKQVVENCLKTDNLVFGYCSSQNIDRLVSFYRAAKKLKRTFVIDIYTAHVLLAASKSGNTIPVPGKFQDVLVYYPYKLCKKVTNNNSAELLYYFKKYKITKEEIGEKRDKLFMLVRPSVQKELELINQLNGSVLIYSLWEGYLESSYVDDFMKWLTEKDVIIKRIHSSGHADYDTLKELVNTIKPKALIPIHTIASEKYSDLYSNVKLCMDGQKLSI